MTPIISLIAVVDRNGAIGRNGQLLYHLPADLKHFKAVTMGKPIVMGRKTFESFPKGALPGRRNIVVTRNAAYTAPGIETAPSLEAALALAGDVPEIMVIGGGEIYAQAFALASRLYLTRLDASAENADTYFPAVDSAEWTTTDRSETATDAATGLGYTFVTLSRRS